MRENRPLYNIINGIDDRFPLTEEKTFTVGYEEDGKKKSWNIAANNDRDAEDKFDDYMSGNGKKKYKVKDTYQSTSNDDDDMNEAFDDGDDDEAYDEYSTDDIVISSDGFRTSVGSEDHGHIGDFDEEMDAYKAVSDWMEENQHWPTVWYQDDHGGMRIVDPYELRDVAEGCGKKKRKSELDEENATSNIDGGYGQPKTPFAFQRSNPTRKDKEKERRNATSSTGWNVTTKTNKYFVRRDEMLERSLDAIDRLIEGKYADFVSDVTKTPKQKINLSIKEANRRLYEIERMINHVSRLKTETGIDDVFWKSTKDRFMKMSERMLRIGTKLRELNQ